MYIGAGWRKRSIKIKKTKPNSQRRRGGGDRGVLEDLEDAVVDSYTRPAGGLSPKNPAGPRRPAVQTRNAPPDYPPGCVSSSLLDASPVTLSGSGHQSASRPKHDGRRTRPR